MSNYFIDGCNNNSNSKNNNNDESKIILKLVME